MASRLEGHAFRHDSKGRYNLEPELFERIHFQATDKSAETISLPILCLPAYMQRKCQLHPHWADIVAEATADSCRSGLQGILYCDEVVPGNVLRPDNARRSYLFYFSCSNLREATRSEFSWALLLVVRQCILKRIPGGLAGMTQAIVAHLEPCFAGFPVQDSKQRSHLVHTTECYLLADEAALKGAVGAKGSSGLRPCILCANALDKTRPEVPDHESIASHNFAAFQPLQQRQLDAYMAHLASLPTKSRLEESQTFLGWRLIPESVVSRPGPLIAERCIYDAMHSTGAMEQLTVRSACYWPLSNKKSGSSRCSSPNTSRSSTGKAILAMSQPERSSVSTSCKQEWTTRDLQRRRSWCAGACSLLVCAVVSCWLQSGECCTHACSMRVCAVVSCLMDVRSPAWFLLGGPARPLASAFLLGISGASLLDSKASFKTKVLEYGLPVALFEAIARRGVDTLSKAAYAVGAPGVLPEDALRSFLNPETPTAVEQGQVAIARRLIFEAQTLAVSQLRQQIEGPDEKRQDLQPAERRFRLDEQARRLAGMSLRGPLECAFSCYTLVIRMLAADEITYLAPNRFTTRAHEVQQSKPPKEVIIDSSSAIKVRDSAELAETCHLPDALSLSQALARRSLALDLCEAQQHLRPQSVGMLSS